jgi:hypothetical protein
LVESSKQPVENDRKPTYNLWRFHGDAAASAVDDAAANYQTPSIIAAGANAQSITLLATLVNLDTSGKAKVSKRGLFYFRDKPAVMPVKRATMKQNAVALYSKPPNMARQRIWVVHEKPATLMKKEIITLPEDIKAMPRRNWLPAERGVNMKTETIQQIEVTPIRRPWFNDPDAFSAYAARNRNKSIAEMEKDNREKSTREKIFYDSDSWNGIRRAIVEADDRESMKAKDTYNIRPVYVTNSFNNFHGAPGSDVRSLLPKNQK